jgi:superfamily II DNA or RNA helicase
MAGEGALFPRTGMLATLRNRRGLITSVEHFNAKPEGRLHLVQVQYTDLDGRPEDTVLWEREHAPGLLEPHALPRIEDLPPMKGTDFDALVRAARWSALTPFLDPRGTGQRSQLPIASPFFGAVQVEDFQLVPLLKALQMPRVSLLLADDVGLGKTIEAGLVLTELLIRRRIRRVLVICPASLRLQWRQEMKDKFSLSFDMVDRTETHALQKRLGMDANPWRTFPRIIASYHYLRQHDVLEQFLATCRLAGQATKGGAQLPWDLLIVDEAHNLMPSNFGEDSDLSKMLRAISPWFEHKLFLTATPHNGHTRCFSGLLEQLDPVRFTQTSDFTDDEKRRIEEVVVRRLKSEINDLDQEAGRTARFAERHLEPVPLYFGREERALSAAVADFRAAVKRLIAAQPRSEQMAGCFAIEVLNKRHLSCPFTFAESWYRFKEGVAADEEVASAEVNAAQRSAEEEIDDDGEREGRAHHAARTVGGWLRPFVGDLQDEIAAIDAGLTGVGLTHDGEQLSVPSHDERFARLKELISKLLRDGNEWRNDERLIIFTEYKTTLDYIDRRLRREFDDSAEAVRMLYGGMSQVEREDIKASFNDPTDSVRILVATDAASEGLNLQETARYLLHYEIPWNPSRLEQRNGRLDRHGQARDVYVHHFTSDDDADLDFVAYVVGKVHEIREDLGSVGELFDAAFQRRFLDQEEAQRVKDSLERDMVAGRNRADVPRQATVTTGAKHAEQLKDLCDHVDLSPTTLRRTLEVALGVGIGQPRLEGPDARGRMKLALPLPPMWESLIDDTVRLPNPRGTGALPGIVFDPEFFIEKVRGRPIFRASKDTVLLHLGHPMFRHALSLFARARFPGGLDSYSATRWTARTGEVPTGVDALVLLTVEELAINELREPVHHWVRTYRFAISGGELGKTRNYVPPAQDRIPTQQIDEAVVDRAREHWDEISLDLAKELRKLSSQLTRQLRAAMKTASKEALKEEKARFAHRLKEVERAMRTTSIKKIEREVEKAREEANQVALLAETARQQEKKLRDLEEELRRRRGHYQDLLEQLKREEHRVIDRMLPKRYQLQGAAQVFPLTVEIRLPEVEG